MNFSIVSCMCYDLMKKICFLIFYHGSMLFICDIGVDLFIEGGLGGQILSVRMNVCFYVIYTWVRACKLLFMFF